MRLKLPHYKTPKIKLPSAAKAKKFKFKNKYAELSDEYKSERRAAGCFTILTYILLGAITLISLKSCGSKPPTSFINIKIPKIIIK